MMKRMHWTVLLVMLIALTLGGCVDNPENDSSLTESETSSDNDVQPGPTGELASLKEIYETFEGSLEVLQNSSFSNLSFSDMEYWSFPDIEDFYLLELENMDQTGSLEETMKTLEACLEAWYPQGLDEEFLKKELRFVNEEIAPINFNADHPYEYPAVYDYYEELSHQPSTMVLFTLPDFHLLVSGKGAYSMSFDRMRELLGDDAKFVERYAGGPQDSEVLVYPSYRLPEEAFPLADREVTMQEAAAFAQDYFENGLPYPIEPGVSLDIPEVGVYELNEETSGFSFLVRRTYAGIPFDHLQLDLWMDQSSDEETYVQDTKTAYMVESAKIEGFTGMQEVQHITPVGEAHTKIVPLEDAAQIAADTLSDKVDFRVQKLELVYCTLETALNGEGEVPIAEYSAAPAWKFTGTNQVNQAMMNVYVDALSGACRYFAFYPD